MDSVSRLVPFWAKSSKVHNSKTKLKISLLEVGFSYLRHRNVRTYYKISFRIEYLGKCSGLSTECIQILISVYMPADQSRASVGEKGGDT